MARNAGVLNAKRIAKLKPGRYSDPDSKGLYLQVGPTGTKSWLFRFWLDKRPERLMGLGAYPDFSLKEARERARAARQLLTDGIDPIEARATARDAKRKEAINNITFKHAAEEYIAAHADGWRNPKHRQQWRNTLREYAYPALGERLVSGIDAATINDAVAPIWQRIPVSAARTKNRIERVIQWVREGKPLPKPSASRRVNHHKALPWQEIPAFMAELRRRESVSARALEFLVLCATRTGETLGGRWSEIDTRERTWTIPPERTKTGKRHRVPLSDRALQILESLPREEENEYLFIGGAKGKSLSNMALLQLMRGMGSEYTPHGMRSSFKDWCSETTNIPNIVSEMALAHTIGNKVEAAYRRGDLFTKRVRLMADWAKYCGSPAPAAAANVTPIQGRRAGA